MLFIFTLKVSSTSEGQIKAEGLSFVQYEYVTYNTILPIILYAAFTIEIDISNIIF